jgi:hypothetical protein
VKKNNLTAAIIIILSYTLSSCKWFNHSNKQPFNITGKWVVDSIAMPKHSAGSKASSAIALGVINQKDSVVVQFSSDSTYKEWKDPFSRKYYIKDSILFAKETTAYVPYKIISKNDSSFNILSNDSIIFFFKKP